MMETLTWTHVLIYTLENDIHFSYKKTCITKEKKTLFGIGNIQKIMCEK